MIGTEHGFSLSLGTQGGSYRLQQVNPHSDEVDVIQTTHHGTTGSRTYMSGDLKNHTQFQVTIQLEGTVGLPEVGAEPEVITITHPAGSGETGGATIAGTGFIASREWAGGAAGGTGLKMATLTIQFDGETPPAFTAATTT